jgi:hypothetical protein
MKNKFCKGMAAALACSTFFYPSAASADPVSIGNLVITGLIGLGAPSAVLLNPAVIGSIVAGVASVGLSLLTAKGAGTIDPGQAKEEIQAEETSELRAIGTVRVTGALNYGNNNHPNLYRHMLHLKGPIDRIVTPYVNEREVIMDSSNRVLSPPWTDFNTDGSISQNYLTLQNKIGDGTETAYPELITAFPDVWTSAHKAQGIFQTLVSTVSPGTSSEKYLKLFGSSQNPKVSYVVRASLLYNPELDSTHTSGSGSHRTNDESTWEWSDNGIVGALNILMQYPEFRDELIDWELQIAEVQAADVLVNTKTGTEKRSRISGVWPSESNRGDVLKQVMDSVGCELVASSSGKYYFKLIDDTPTSQVTFTEADYYDIEWQSGPKAIERPNTCQVKYYSPERDYEMSEIDLTGIPWATIDDEVDRWGEKVLSIDLPFCPSASQAQRIARRIFSWARADAGTVITNLSGMAAFGCQYGTLEIMGDNELCKITSPRCNDLDGEVDIAFISLPTLAAWDTSADEADAPEPYAVQEDDTALDTPDVPTSVFGVIYEDGTSELRVTYSSVTSATGYLAAYAALSASGSRDAYVPMTKYANKLISYVAGDYLGDNLELKVQAFDSDGSSNFSGSLVETSVSENLSSPISLSGLSVTQTEVSVVGGVRTELNGSVNINSPNIIKIKLEYALSESSATFITELESKQTPSNFSIDISVPGSQDYETLRITQTVHGGETLVETFDIT